MDDATKTSRKAVSARSEMVVNLDVDSACKMLFGQPIVRMKETVSLGDALSRVSSETVRAIIPVPPFDRSPYDGYAFRGEDTLNATRESPVVLKITEEIPAGVAPRFEVKPGLAAKILTGAPIPKGADSTIKYENTTFTESDVKIFEQIKPNTDIVKKGADVMPGRELAAEGALITAPIPSGRQNSMFCFKRLKGLDAMRSMS